MKKGFTRNDRIMQVVDEYFATHKQIGIPELTNEIEKWYNRERRKERKR